jgi:hypothetical protein
MKYGTTQKVKGRCKGNKMTRTIQTGHNIAAENSGFLIEQNRGHTR